MEHIVLCPGWEMCNFKPSLKFFFSFYLKVYIADVFAEMLHVCMAYVWIDAKVTTSWSSLNMDLKIFSMWDHSLD